MATTVCFVVLSLLAAHPFGAKSAPSQVLPGDATEVPGPADLVTTSFPPMALLENQGKNASERGGKLNASENQEILPPQIFYPPTQPDVPILAASGANFLKFEFKLKCEGKGKCPSSYMWDYRKKGDKGRWKEEANTQSIVYNGSAAGSVVYISGLESNTSYEVRAQPLLKDEESKPLNWYHNIPTSPFSPTATGLTCDVPQDAVRELKVHSAGPKWLALSWRHPMPNCNTQLQYHARHKGNLLREWSDWRNAGSFWTNASWSVQGEVKPCYLWPDRHCLLLMNGRITPDKDYTVEIKVERIGDGKMSEVASIQGKTKSFKSSSPEKLRCVESRSTSLSLSWASPMEPGGELTIVRIYIYDVNGQLEKAKDKEVDMQPYYEENVGDLKSATLYNVTVMFVSADGLVGKPAQIVAWTSPEEDENFGGSCYQGSPANSSASMSKAAASSVPGVTNDAVSSWPWLLVPVAIVGVAVVFFVIGRRCPKEISWKVVSLSNGSSSSSSEGSTGLSKLDVEHGSSDLEALCIGTRASSKDTPPSSIADYAESSGYAVISSPTAVVPSSFSCRNQYAVPNHVMEEQPYAEALDARDPLPPPLYTEVRRPSPTPSPMNIPLYAEVDKKRHLPPPPPLKVPPPPKKPPLPHILPLPKIPPPLPAKPSHLQDSD